MASPIVYVVDDEPMIRTAVSRLLGTVGLSCQTFGEASAFLADIDLERNGCVVLDFRLPHMSGMEVYRQLTERGSILPVIFLTGYADVSSAVRAMKAGAADVLSKPIDSQALLDAIQQAILHDLQKRSERDAVRRLRLRADRLTGREREVMSLVVAGWPNRRIAEELGTTEKTVKVHRANVMVKMEAHSLAELVRIVDRLGGSSVPQHRAIEQPS
jgi:FixJ family two-component response regulator